MKSFGFLSKISRAARNGNLAMKVRIYLWYYLGGAWLAGTVSRMSRIRPNRIVMYNMRGNSFGDHQKYITLELLRRRIPVEIIWLVRDRDSFALTAPKEVKVVDYASFAALRALAAARIWCVNQSQNYFIFRGLKKRVSQVYIQTYHGSLGIKRIGADRAADGTVRLWESVLRRDAGMIDYLIADSRWEAETVYKSRFFGFGECKLFGHPRNDVFFRDGSDVRKKIQDTFGVSKDENILFYAPTHRTDRRCDVLCRNLTALASAVEKRFGGKWRMMVRLHPNMLSYVKDIDFGEETLDATCYPDMQELLIASDALISDYSSCMFDFMLTRRPVFVYAPDIEEYQKVQGFYYPMSETPFPVAMTEQELIENINAFDAVKYKAEVEAFLEDKGCVEDGHATERTVDLIERLLKS